MAANMIGLDWITIATNSPLRTLSSGHPSLLIVSDSAFIHKTALLNHVNGNNRRDETRLGVLSNWQCCRCMGARRCHRQILSQRDFSRLIGRTRIDDVRVAGLYCLWGSIHPLGLSQAFDPLLP